jgi:hypothetical protein
VHFAPQVIPQRVPRLDNASSIITATASTSTHARRPGTAGVVSGHNRAPCRRLCAIQLADGRRRGSAGGAGGGDGSCSGEERDEGLPRTGPPRPGPRRGHNQIPRCEMECNEEFIENTECGGPAGVCQAAEHAAQVGRRRAG